MSVIQEIVERSANLEGYLKNRFEYANIEDQSIKIKTEIEKCPVCKNKLITKKIKKTGVLIVSMALNVDVYVKQCKTENCSKIDMNFNFQGEKHGIININNKFFVAAECIKEYFDSFSRNGTPFSSFLQIKLDMTKLAQTVNNTTLPFTDVSKIKCYTGVLHEGFCASIHLFLYDKGSFMCCETPHTIQMDGVVISIPTSKMPKLEYPWINDKSYNRASNRKDRQLESLSKVEEEALKTLIESKMCSSNEKKIFDNSTHIGARVIGVCLMKQNDGYELYHGTRYFALTLIKKVAAACSILPKSCVSIVEK